MQTLGMLYAALSEAPVEQAGSTALCLADAGGEQGHVRGCNEVTHLLGFSLAAALS